MRLKYNNIIIRSENGYFKYNKLQRGTYLTWLNNFYNVLIQDSRSKDNKNYKSGIAHQIPIDVDEEQMVILLTMQMIMLSIILMIILIMMKHFSYNNKKV